MIIKPLRLLASRTCALSSSALAQDCQDVKRLLRVAIIGSPNVGKSTLLNRLTGYDISCVSNKVHTTRANVLGVVTEANTQLEFYDSPGMVSKEHMLKHNLEHPFYFDPKKATTKCDLILAVADASNIREKKRLNQGVIKILNSHPDKESVLILNKVDAIKDKRELLEIGTRLTEGCIEGKLTIPVSELRRMAHEDLTRLNLCDHLPETSSKKRDTDVVRKKHKYVIDLEPENEFSQSNEAADNKSPSSYRNFSRLFSISALKDDGVEELKEFMLSRAKPVERWPHGPDYLTNQESKDLVHNIIRGKLMDLMDGSLPYQVKLHLTSHYDELGSLHVHAVVVCPKRYMCGLVLGERGSTVQRLIVESRESICRNLCCEVKLAIDVRSSQVESAAKSKRRPLVNLRQ